MKGLMRLCFSLYSHRGALHHLALSGPSVRLYASGRIVTCGVPFSGPKLTEQFRPALFTVGPSAIVSNEKQHRTKMAGELEDFLGSALQWDDWTLSIVNMVTRVAALVNKKVLALPVEIHITSVNDELLLKSLLQADANGKPFGRVLESDQSKWHSPNIFPITAVVRDCIGNHVEMTFG